MNLGLDLSMSMGMEQRLSPQMIQSLKLLQMTSLELEMVVQQELETNPLLETVEDADANPKDEDKKGEDETPEGALDGVEAPVADEAVPEPVSAEESAESGL